MLEVLLHTAPASAGQVLLWSVLGVLGGLAVGAGAALLLSRLGAFRLEWRHARWMRVLAALWILAAGLAAGGAVGGCEGTWRGTRRAVADPAFREGPLLRAAGCVSAGVAWLDLKLRNAPEEALTAYVDGKATLDVPAFYGRLAKARGEVVDGLVATWNAQAQARLGLGRSEVVDALLGAALRLVAAKLVDKAVHDSAEKAGVASAKDGFFTALDRTSGTHADLSARLLDDCVVPLALLPVRALIRGQQTAAALLGALAMLVPVLAFWIGRVVERRKACTKPLTGDILPATGTGTGSGTGAVAPPGGDAGGIAP
ncbi:MAG TPA: hypothetical protein VF950_13865 [Planctomycetota bacterium]